MIKKFGLILFLADIIFGLYFLNIGMSLITLPAFFISINKAMNLVGGILLIVGGVFALRRFSYRIIR